MTTITINKGKKDDIALILEMAKRLGIDFSVTESKTKKLSEAQKQKAIMDLSKKVNRNMTKRMYAEHNLSLPK